MALDASKVKKVGFRSQNRLPAYSRFIVSLPFLLAVACTGTIGDEHSGAGGPNGLGASNSGGGASGAGSGGGTPGSGAATGPANTGTGTGPVVIQPAPSSRFIRLNHQQWENSVRDALRLSATLGISKTFVAEPLLSTFDNNGSVLSVSADLWHDYQSAAETVANKVARDAKLLAAIAPTSPTDPAGKAKAFVQSVGSRVIRRPLTDAEVTGYVNLFNQGPTLIGSADAFADGVELVLTALLQSPFFIYRTELGTAAAGLVRLDDYEVASKLSYALTNSMPDDALFAAAGAKQLETSAGVMQEATRVLTLTAAADTIGDFHNQLLRMRDYDAVIKDATKFPLFATGAAADMKQETLSFIKNVIIDQGRGYSDLLTAPYTFANSRIAQIYGLSARTPSAGQPDPFVRVDLDPQQRAGFLTQVGFLATNGVGSTPNIIIRGVHIAKDLLCVDLPPPPNIIPPIPAPMPNSTNRQRIDALTAGAPCNGCHTTRINPLGFAFESLDGVGAFRTTDNGLPINTAASYVLDGQTVNFNGAVELVKAMAASEQAHDCYSRRLIEYLFARAVDPQTSADQNLITQAGGLSKNNTSIKNLIANLVTSDAFLARLP